MSNTLPQIGDTVVLKTPYQGYATGRVSEVLDGIGWLISVEFIGYHTRFVDFNWQREVAAAYRKGRRIV